MLNRVQTAVYNVNDTLGHLAIIESETENNSESTLKG